MTIYHCSAAEWREFGPGRPPAEAAKTTRFAGRSRDREAEGDADPGSLQENCVQ
jgi:hypothetical protein